MKSRSSASERLVEIADRLRALARSGLHYATDSHSRERYEQIVSLAIRLANLSTNVAPEDLERLFRTSDAGYITPKLDVRLAVFVRDGDPPDRGGEEGDADHRVLLVRERSDGRWALPGGYVDVGDSPAEAAVRETWEEAGIRVRAVALAGVFDPRVQPDAPPHLFHIHKLVFTGTLLDPEARPEPGPEVHEARFHPVRDLPELSLGRTLPLHVREALRVARDPSAPAYFD